MNCTCCGLPIDEIYRASWNDPFRHPDFRCIEALKAELATLREQTAPRRFSEQQPEEGFLLVFHDNEHLKQWFGFSHWKNPPDPWWTHWLPMPPAPEE